MPPSGDACLFGLGMLELGLNPIEMLPPLKAAVQRSADSLQSWGGAGLADWRS